MTSATPVLDDLPILAPGTGRLALLERLTARLTMSGLPWAFQGAVDAPLSWAGSDTTADLDVWVRELPPAVADFLDSLPGARVADTRDPRRLRHVTWAVLLDERLAVVDLTVGDLVVGAVQLVPADAVAVTRASHGPVLQGEAAVADLLVRPVLRGRLPDADRLDAARATWQQLGPVERGRLLGHLGGMLGARLRHVLEGVGPVSAHLRGSVLRAGRRAMLRAALHPLTLTATWRQRWSVVPAGRAAGPLGLRTRGVVVALVGTDGAGKSTVQHSVREQLERLGMPTSTAYFGMARGNLPGVGLARRMLGVDSSSPAVAAGHGRPVMAEPLARPRLRRAAAWCYAAEYTWRWIHLVAPALMKRRVVLCDRWVTDLRESPWPGSPAARFVERLVPHPDVLVLPDAPDAVIHARKPERPAAEQARQQQVFRNLLGEGRARFAAVVVDTTGDVPDVSGAVAAVLGAAHVGRRRRA